MSSISSHSIFLTIYGQPRRDTLTVFPVYQPIGWNKTFVHSGIRKQNSLQVFLLLWAEYLFHKQKDWGLISAPKKQEPCFKTGLQSYFLIQSDTGEDWGSGAGIRDHLSVMSKYTEQRHSLEWGTEQFQKLRKRECLGTGIGGGTALRPSIHDAGNPNWYSFSLFKKRFPWILQWERWCLRYWLCQVLGYKPPP